MLKIAVVGHSRIIEAISESAKKAFSEIDIIKIEFNDMDMKNAAVEYLKAWLDRIDGVVFTGKTPYEIVNNDISVSVPHAYIHQDRSMLLQALMEAVVVKEYDIKKFSCDAYSEEEIIDAFSGFNEANEWHEVIAAPLDIEGSRMIDILYTFHKDNFYKNNAKFCITGVSKVYEKLNADNIPAVHLRPTADSVSNAIHELLSKINVLNNAESRIVIISMEIDLPGEYNLIHENEYQLMLEKTRVTEQVYRFAELIQAAVVEVGLHNYLLFSTAKIFESVTNSFVSLPILNAARQNSVHTLSIGVGYGKTARQARYNASIGLNRALAKGGNQAFIVENGIFSDPIYPDNGENEEFDLIADPLFSSISNETGISINNIYKLHCIKEKTKKDCFTSSELSEEFGSTRRSINRIIEKLETAGYAKVEGTRMMTETGRPSRIIKLMF